MIAETFRLSIRLHRFEIIATVGFIALATIAAVAMAWGLDELWAGSSCGRAGDPAAPGGCPQGVPPGFYALAARAIPIFWSIAVLPAVGGLVLGSVLVGKELERGTARLAWSLAPSRRRWFVARVGPVLVVLLALSFAAGAAADRLAAAQQPGFDPGANFDGYGLRGVLITARAALFLAVGLACGAILGRALPAIIVGGFVAIGILVGGGGVHDGILAGETIVRPDDSNWPGDRFVDSRFRLPDGRLGTWVDVEPLLTPEGEFPPSIGFVPIVLPAERYREVEGREALAVGGLSLLGIGLAGVVTTRRRPT